MIRLLPTLLLTACIPDFPSKKFIDDPTHDHDGDSFTELDGDCDDNNALAYPGAEEVCDGMDNDCNGETDEEGATGGTEWYFDADRDGYGTDGFRVTACVAPSEDYVAQSGDCDDATAGINPGAQEYCSGRDDDCDDLTDYDDDSVAGLKTWYINQDGDAYGVDDPETNVEACDPPLKYAYDPGDCDDADPLVNPSAIERCDGADNDCDGLTDDDDDDMVGEGTWYADTDGDGFGSAVSGAVEQCAPPDGHVGNNSDCDDTNALISPDGEEVCNESDDDCDDLIDEGLTITAYEDADGDGHGTMEGAALSVCSIADGLSAEATDCDDSDGGVYPGATETCNDTDDDCDGLTDEGLTVTAYEDRDGDGFGDVFASPVTACEITDGFSSEATDCNDLAVSVYPGATETCNDTDDDCDGVTDEGVTTTYFRDADADGYGTPEESVEACSQPDGFSSDWTDCDDADDSAHPGGTEVCDGVDNDCNEEVDESAATDATDWYLDADGDGHGDGSVTTRSCEAPTGYVANNTDCDDFKDTVHPEQAESCFTAFDDDCDEDNNDEDATGCLTHYADADEDGHGDPEDSICVCADKGVYTTRDVGDCDDAVATTHVDAPELCSTAVDDDCDGSTNDDGASGCTSYFYDHDGDGFGVVDQQCLCEPQGYYEALVPGDCDDDNSLVNPEAGDPSNRCGLFGEVSVDQAVASGSFVANAVNKSGGAVSAGDINGDGFDDIMIGNTQYDAATAEGTYANAGAAFIWYGPISGNLDTTASTTADAVLHGVSASAECGHNVFGLVDVNEDGYGDVLMQCEGEQTAYLLHGPFDGEHETTDAVASLPARYRALGVGDLNGDSETDFLVSSPADDTNVGRIFHGPIDGFLATEDYGSVLGDAFWGSWGSNEAAVADDILGDMTGDGLNDLVTLKGGHVQAWHAFDAGGASVFADIRQDGSNSIGSIASGGDLNGDGHADLFIGNVEGDPRDEFAGTISNAGTVYLVPGPLWGVDVATIEEVASTAIHGDAESMRLGKDIDAVSDIDGDGHRDVVLGSQPGHGAARQPQLLYGPLAEGVIWVDTADASFTDTSGAGYSVHTQAAGDTNGDGNDDFFLISRYNIYLFLGEDR